MESLETKVNGFLYGNAARRPVNEKCGPFHIGFSPDSDNPYANYAVPESGAVVSASDVADLVAAFEARRRTPRLEFAPGGAPGVEQALLAAGFEVQQRLPFMVVAPSDLVGPAPIAGIEVVTLDGSATDDELFELVAAQNAAFDAPPPADRAATAAGLRSSLAEGTSAVLARGAAGTSEAGIVMGGGQAGSPLAGTTEVGGIATREAFRRRGIGAAVTAALTRHLFEVRGLECVWLSPAGPDQERLYASVGYRSLGEMLFIWRPEA